jgi:hypothetical protein
LIQNPSKSKFWKDRNDQKENICINRIRQDESCNEDDDIPSELYDKEHIIPFKKIHNNDLSALNSRSTINQPFHRLNTAPTIEPVINRYI